MPVLRVGRPGLGTTIQDLGRRGCLELGIPTGGAADVYSHRLANAVLGNQPSAATLEMMLLGASFTVLDTTLVAAAGAEMPFRLNGAGVEMGEPVPVTPGDLLDFGKARTGCFAYLAVAGGFQGAVALGSRSTYVPGRLGGHFGRALRRGDHLEAVEGPAGGGSWKASPGVLAWPRQSQVLRFVRGPQQEYFTEAGYRTFTGDGYTVSTRSNRVAYRFEGPAPELVRVPRTPDTGSGPTDIIEDGNAVGAVQVAGGTEPICMGRDCPSSGAYAKIGCVITPDVSRMAQLQPADAVRFQEVSVDEAHAEAVRVGAAMDGFGSP